MSSPFLSFEIVLTVKYHSNRCFLKLFESQLIQIFWRFQEKQLWLNFGSKKKSKTILEYVDPSNYTICVKVFRSFDYINL